MLIYVDSMVFETWFGVGRRRLWTKRFLLSLSSNLVWFIGGVKRRSCYNGQLPISCLYFV